MAFDYSGLAATAVSLIANYGRSLTLTKKGSTATNPAAPWLGGTATDSTSSTITGVEMQGTDAFKDDDRVRATDRAWLLDGAIEPEEGDKVTDGTKLFEIVAAQRIQPGDTALAYIVAARG